MLVHDRGADMHGDWHKQLCIKAIDMTYYQFISIPTHVSCWRVEMSAELTLPAQWLELQVHWVVHCYQCTSYSRIRQHRTFTVNHKQQSKPTAELNRTELCSIHQLCEEMSTKWQLDMANGWLVGWLVFDGTFCTNRLYCAIGLQDISCRTRTRQTHNK